MSDLQRRIAEACGAGLHVTTRTICGVTFAIIHEPTNEARQKAIDEFNSVGVEKRNE